MRDATPDDWPAIWPIWHAIVLAGETYTWDPSTSDEDARAEWMLPPPAVVLVLEDDEEVVRATAVLRPNKEGRGDHVANASFMVDPTAHGKGFGRALAEAVLERARADAFEAMQFNAVVATNKAAIRLWESLGFEIVGTIPAAFRHETKGKVPLHVMHRFL